VLLNLGGTSLIGVPYLGDLPPEQAVHRSWSILALTKKFRASVPYMWSFRENRCKAVSGSDGWNVKYDPEDVSAYH